MFQYLFILLAAFAVFGGPDLQTQLSAGPAFDYVVAFGIALLLKPWLEYHLD